MAILKMAHLSVIRKFGGLSSVKALKPSSIKPHPRNRLSYPEPHVKKAWPLEHKTASILRKQVESKYESSSMLLGSTKSSGDQSDAGFAASKAKVQRPISQAVRTKAIIVSLDPHLHGSNHKIKTRSRAEGREMDHLTTGFWLGFQVLRSHLKDLSVPPP